MKTTTTTPRPPSPCAPAQQCPGQAGCHRPHGLKAPLPVTMGPPSSEPDEVRTLVEIDHRRASIGVHIASDLTRAARTSTSLWLDPDRAAALANEILAAVATWREHQQTVAWTATTGGRSHAR